MPITSVILVLVASVFHVLRTVMTKTSENKLLFVWWMSFISLIMLSPFCVYFFIKTSPGLPIILFSIGMGLVHASYWKTYALAYEKGEVSHVYPIIHSAPAFVLMFGILFFGEKPGLMGVLGILCITLGVYVLNAKKLSLKKVTEPLGAIFTERSTRLAFLALVLVTAYSLLDKVAVSQIHPLAYVLMMTVSALIVFSFFIRSHLGAGFLRPIQMERKKVLVAALCASLNYPLVLFALQLTNASYVSGVRQLSVVLAALVGLLFLKEKFSLPKVCAVLLIFFGAVLVVV